MEPKARKTEIRRELVAQILAMDPLERRAQESSLHQRFATLPGLAQASTVLLYASGFPEELDTRPILGQALELGKRVILPRVHRRSGSLRLFEVKDIDHDLQPGHRGIPEPRPGCPSVDPLAIDWVLVPGLGFTGQCQRLGRGAGHYDRLLPTLGPLVPRWALIFDTQWHQDFPVMPHDQPLDGVADAHRIVLGRRVTSVGHSITAFGGAS